MHFHFDSIIGKSKAIRDVLDLVKKVANTQATVLITGDSGTGKELIALALHTHCDRRDNLSIAARCRRPCWRACCLAT
jgi:two-component system, NtrC family, response regulator